MFQISKTNLGYNVKDDKSDDVLRTQLRNNVAQIDA